MHVLSGRCPAEGINRETGVGWGSWKFEVLRGAGTLHPQPRELVCYVGDGFGLAMSSSPWEGCWNGDEDVASPFRRTSNLKLQTFLPS